MENFVFVVPRLLLTFMLSGIKHVAMNDWGVFEMKTNQVTTTNCLPTSTLAEVIQKEYVKVAFY